MRSRLKYGTGMRINAALKVLAEKRAKRQERKLEAWIISRTLQFALHNSAIVMMCRLSVVYASVL